jgi:hypothetical protein
MRTTLVAIFIFWISFFGNAQNCRNSQYLKQGTTLEMASYDKNGTLQSLTESTVKNTTEIANGYVWIIKSVHKDKKGNKISESEVELKCQNGTLYISPKHLFDQNQLQNIKDLDAKIETEDLEFPSELRSGQKLKNGTIKIKAFVSGMQILNMEISVFDRIVEEQTNLTVKAGTFTVYKISQNIKVSNNFMNVEGKSVDYYLPGLGVIKSINMNKKGELEGYSEMISYKEAK